MKSPFREDYQSPKTDPLYGRASTDFDWDAVSKALGEELPAETDIDALAVALKLVLSWCVRGNVRCNTDRIIGRRVIALAWALSPSYFDGSPSLAEISRRLGVHKDTLPIITASIRRKFGIINRAQVRHAWSITEAHHRTEAQAETQQRQAASELAAGRARRSRKVDKK